MEKKVSRKKKAKIATIFGDEVNRPKAKCHACDERIDKRNKATFFSCFECNSYCHTKIACSQWGPDGMANFVKTINTIGASQHGYGSVKCYYCNLKNENENSSATVISPSNSNSVCRQSAPVADAAATDNMESASVYENNIQPMDNASQGQNDCGGGMVQEHNSNEIITADNVDGIITAALAASQEFNIEVSFDENLAPSTSFTMVANQSTGNFDDELVLPLSSNSDDDVLSLNEHDTMGELHDNDQTMDDLVMSTNNELAGGPGGDQQITVVTQLVNNHSVTQIDSLSSALHEMGRLTSELNDYRVREIALVSTINGLERQKAALNAHIEKMVEVDRLNTELMQTKDKEALALTNEFDNERLELLTTIEKKSNEIQVLKDLLKDKPIDTSNDGDLKGIVATLTAKVDSLISSSDVPKFNPEDLRSKLQNSKNKAKLNANRTQSGHNRQKGPGSKAYQKDKAVGRRDQPNDSKSKNNTMAQPSKLMARLTPKVLDIDDKPQPNSGKKVSFRIIGVPTFIGGDKFLGSMIRQNNIPKNLISLHKDEFINAKRNLRYHTTPPILTNLLRNRHVFVNGRKYMVMHHSATKQCYHCLELDHVQHSCSNEQKCVKCGGNHPLRECAAHKYNCYNCSVANQRDRTQTNTNHKATDSQYPAICHQMAESDDTI